MARESLAECEQHSPDHSRNDLPSFCPSDDVRMFALLCSRVCRTLLSIRHLLHSIFSFNGSGGETFIGAAEAAADYHSGPLHFTRIIEDEEKEVSDFIDAHGKLGGAALPHHIRHG